MTRAFNSAAAMIMAIITFSAMFLFVTPLTAGKAEAQTTVTADKTTEVLFNSGSRKITGNLVIRKDSILPKGATLSVKKGGKLYVLPGVSLTVEGTLKVASGGAVFVQGDMNIHSTGIVSCTGKLKIQKSGNVSLDGTMRVNKGGNVFGSGKLNVLGDFSDIKCKGTVTAKIVPPDPIEQDGITTVGGVMIVNRVYSLPSTYGNGIEAVAYNAFLKMKNASGYNMSIVSGFRSYEKQKETFAYWESIDGFEKADRYSSQAGHSEHQTGLTMDISSLSQSYGKTDEGKWLAAHCWEYGFIIRYPEGCENITGYIYEPWHVRYLGTSTAKLVHDSGLTLEEFLGVKGWN